LIEYSTYKVIHLLGVFLVLFALGGAAINALHGGSRTSRSARKSLAITHGLGLVIALVAGFGLLARLGISNAAGWPLWVWSKLGIWLVLGGMIALISRKPSYARVLWVVTPLLAALAAHLAVNKPF
jgi:hypothetical protein